MQSGQALNTVRAYASSWRVFRRWCADAGRVPLPASTDSVSLFIAHMVEQGLRVQTLNLRLAAILRHHTDAGFSSPIDASVRELVNSVARERKEAPAGKAALTVGQLRRICRMLERDGLPIAVRDRALLLLGFASGFRGSSLGFLDVADVTFKRRDMLVLLRSSKADQEGKGHLVGIKRGDHELTCPVRAVRAWLAVRGETPGALFTHVSPQGDVIDHERRLGYPGVHERVKVALRRIGVNPDNYGSHSLRAGFATAAADAGASEFTIMRQGGWKNIQTLTRYVRPARVLAGNPLAGVL